MKKILRGILILLLISQNVLAIDEAVSEEKTIIEKDRLILEKEEVYKENDKEDNFEKPILLELESQLDDKVKGAAEYNDFENIAPNGILSDKLTFKFNKGLIKEHKTQLMTFYGFTQTIDKEDSDFNFRVLYIKLGLMGKLRSEKEKYVITANLTPGLHENFIKSLPLDSYIESSRIKNHKIKVGTFRPNLGYEGSLALFLIPLLYKTQIARNLSDMRKTGLSINGEYKYLNYSIEGFSSNTQYQSIFAGPEGNIWVDFKPLAKLNNKDKYGKLKLGGGFQAGKRDSIDYNIVSAALRYDYKNLWLSSEYAYANGSNGGDGLTNKTREGYNITLGYLPTEKLELMLRYDYFNNDKNLIKSGKYEYTAGFNYYIYKEALVLMINYSYLQNETNASPDNDSHRFIIGAQLLI